MPYKNLIGSHPLRAFDDFDELRKDNRFIDVVLIAEGVRFPAHRVVLCSCSSYFDRMFQSGFKEQSSNEIELQGIESGTMKLMLDFIYGKAIMVDELNAQDLLIGANQLLLTAIRDAAGEVLGKMIEIHNAVIIKNLGQMFDCQVLENRAEIFILERFEYVCQTEDFLKLEAQEVLRHLENDKIMVKSEETIFNCILRWIEKEPTIRKKHFDFLISGVRFPLLSEHTLERLKSSGEPDYVQQSSKCLQLIKEALAFRRDQKNSVKRPLYRGFNQMLLLQSSKSYLKTPPVIFDFAKSSWVALEAPTPPCKHRDDSTFEYLDNTVYSIGGETSQEALNEPFMENPRTIIVSRDVYFYCLEEFYWSKHSKLNIPRKRHASIMVGSKCFVLGGYTTNSQPTDSVEMINLRTDSNHWKLVAPMLNKRVSFGVVELNGCIYAIGGWDGQNIVKSIEKFDPNTGKWTHVTDFINMRMKFGVAAMDGKIFIVGGCLQTYDTCYTSEYYDLEKDEWTSIPEPKHARSNPVLIPYRGKLYLFGGEGTSQGAVECFDFYSKHWTVLQTQVKQFINGGYTGCLVDKPWDWDEVQINQLKARQNIKKMLVGHGLNVVQNMAAEYYDPSSS